MSPVSFQTIPQYALVRPYLSAQEWKDAPTGVDPTNLVIGGSQLSEDQQLGAIILRASSWANIICGQNLAATVDIEGGRVAVNRRGELIVHPHCWPILEVQSVSAGPSLTGLVALDISNCWIDRQYFVVGPGTTGTSSIGPIQFATAAYGSRYFMKWQYVNGYPVTTLTSTASSGQATIVVADTTGIYAGTPLQIYDDTAGNEAVTVLATPTTSTVTLTANLVNTHASGQPVTSLPPAVKEAVILLTAAIIRTRGAESIVMESIEHKARKVKGSSESFDNNVKIAEEMLRPFSTVRGGG